ncbi:hypothetical protein cyc_04686 [Cyclospora cayetanensis]|uniref:Uncharacterized protein n=1 Tax=Cyclospora cayetanensis TaxID=88456 RepID=A0A1D3CRF2_9EIME|nr:hypothetical protein cyc_04686 [Cyclospora cayetanensis]
MEAAPSWLAREEGSHLQPPPLEDRHRRMRQRQVLLPPFLPLRQKAPKAAAVQGVLPAFIGGKATCTCILARNFERHSAAPRPEATPSKKLLGPSSVGVAGASPFPPGGRRHGCSGDNALPSSSYYVLHAKQAEYAHQRLGTRESAAKRGSQPLPRVEVLLHLEPGSVCLPHTRREPANCSAAFQQNRNKRAGGINDRETRSSDASRHQTFRPHSRSGKLHSELPTFNIKIRTCSITRAFLEPTTCRLLDFRITQTPDSFSLGVAQHPSSAFLEFCNAAGTHTSKTLSASSGWPQGDGLLQSVHQQASNTPLLPTAQSTDFLHTFRAPALPHIPLFCPCLNAVDLPQSEGFTAERCTSASSPCQEIELQFECLDGVSLSHPAARVSLCCFLRPEEEHNSQCQINSVEPFLLSGADSESTAAAQQTPQAFVDFKGARMRMLWRGEEFLHLKINEEVHGESSSTGFIKLQFSSLQENIPMRVDVINRSGLTNGFLILRYALLGDVRAEPAIPLSAGRLQQHPSAEAAELWGWRDPSATQKSGKEAADEECRTPPKQKGEPRRSQIDADMFFAHRIPLLKHGGSTVLSRFGRWCCELPSVDLN